MSFPLENKTDDETRPHTMPRKTSLRLLTTTPNTPVPPSLKTSPYLKSPVFNCGLASPTLPSEEDEKWLQDTIPLPSRHHEQVAGWGQLPPSARGAVTSGHSGIMQKGAPHRHHRRHLSATPPPSNFVPPSLAVILDSNIGWQSAGLYRRWSTGPLRPQNPAQDIYHFEKLFR